VKHEDEIRPYRHIWVVWGPASTNPHESVILGPGVSVKRQFAVTIGLVVLVSGLAACASAESPLDVADEWLTAYESGDVSTYQALMDREATFDCIDCGYPRATTDYFAPGGGAEQDVRDSRLLALGGGTLSPSCTLAEDTVRCLTERVSAFGYFDADGQPTQVDRSVYEFEFEGDRIVHLTVTRQGGNLFDFNTIQGYRAWVQENHPNDYDELFILSTILIDGDDQFATHQELASEYLSAP